MRGKNGISRNAYVPPEIESDGLLKMDVDQPVWQEVNIADFPDGKVPDWLADESVRTNIRVAQEVINCKQDMLRCRAEHSNLRTWFNTEVKAVQRAFDISGVSVVYVGSFSLMILTVCLDSVVKHFLLLRLHYLYDLGLRWRADAVGLPAADDGQEWDLTPPPTIIRPARSHASTKDVVEQLATLDGMSNDASSDDDDSGEVEEAPTEIDAVVLSVLDYADSS
jgi:hypothetical protein